MGFDKDRRGEDPRFKKLFLEVDVLKKQHALMNAKIDLNTQATLETRKNTAEIVVAWQAIAGGIKVLGWLGVIARWLAYIAGAITAISAAWYAVTHWGTPTPPDIPN